MEVMVSVLVTAYNHESYIAQALDGFMMQKTDFPFEVIVHDDASTDSTAEIIRAYSEKYPDIIKPIYQKVNQYSQGIDIYENMISCAQGRYFAICEGDDYWTDSLKLQKQFDALEAHPEISICTHAAKVEINGKISREKKPSDTDAVFTVDEVIKGGGGFVATVSTMVRRDIETKNLSFYKILDYDYSMRILASLQGGMLYLNDCMAVYRLHSKGSWSEYMSSHVEQMDAHITKVREMLDKLNLETDYTHDAAIRYAIKRIEFGSLERHKKYKQMLAPQYRECRSNLSVKDRLRICLLALLLGNKAI